MRLKYKIFKYYISIIYLEKCSNVCETKHKTNEI